LTERRSLATRRCCRGTLLAHRYRCDLRVLISNPQPEFSKMHGVWVWLWDSQVIQSGSPCSAHVAFRSRAARRSVQLRLCAR
jgi:hypothetical protein